METEIERLTDEAAISDSMDAQQKSLTMGFIRFDKLAVLAVICFWPFVAIASAQLEQVSADEREKLIKVYEVAARHMSLSSPCFAARSKEAGTKLRAKVLDQTGKPKILAMHGEPLLIMVWRDSFRLISVVNKLLDSVPIHNKDQSATSTMGRDAAVERARQYCGAFSMPVPADFRMADASFRGGQWAILWRRFCGPYAWDDYEETECVDVGFHESDGLVAIRNQTCQPLPKSVDVKLSREQAVAKATKYVPLVQRSPFYRQARMDGFVIKAVKSCELRVSVPNWFFNPLRANLRPKGLPRETRLSWVVSFETVDSKEQERNLKDKEGGPAKLVAPEITIYIDAATGDAVGARYK